MPTPLPDFYDALAAHDFDGLYAQDDAAAMKARDAEIGFMRASRESEPHRAMYNAFLAHHFGSGKKPVRPAAEAVLA